MSAIITDPFRRNTAKTLYQDIFDEDTVNKYYVGIGKTDQWELDIDNRPETDINFKVPAPTGSKRELQEVLNNLMSLVAVDSSHLRRIIPNVPWRIGNYYKSYDAYDTTCFVPTTRDGVTLYPCYAITDNKIVLCLKKSSAKIYSNPTGLTLYQEFSDRDYVWIPIAEVENIVGAPFNTTQFISVVEEPDNYSSGAGKSANAATRGKVYDFTVISAGSGYNIGDASPGVPLTRAYLVGDADIRYVTFNNFANTVTLANHGLTNGTVIQFSQIDNNIGTIVVNTPYYVIAATAGNFQLATSLGGDFIPITADSAGTLKSQSVMIELDRMIGTGGVITSVSFKSTTSSSLKLGFVNASVVIIDTGAVPGTKALVIPDIAPIEGFGVGILNNLPTWFLGLATDFINNLSGDSGKNVIGDAQYLSYRQISLIKNPVLDAEVLDGEGNVIDDKASADALQYLTIPGSITEILAVTGDIITQPIADAVQPKAFFDSYVYDSATATGRLYFHQNDSSKVNYRKFVVTTGASIYINNVTGTTYAFNALNDSEYHRNTGEVLFLENRKAISRNSNQTEEIKLVIQL